MWFDVKNNSLEERHLIHILFEIRNSALYRQVLSRPNFIQFQNKIKKLAS